MADADYFYRRIQPELDHVYTENDGRRRLATLCCRSHELSVEDGALTTVEDAIARLQPGEGLIRFPKGVVTGLNLKVTLLEEQGNAAHCHIDVNTSSQAKKLLKDAEWVHPIEGVDLR